MPGRPGLWPMYVQNGQTFLLKAGSWAGREGRRMRGTLRRAAGFAILVFVSLSLSFVMPVPAAAVTVTVPYSATPVADDASDSVWRRTRPAARNRATYIC